MGNVATLVDGNPDNNFLKESETVRFNPDGALTGATFVAAAGHRLYMTTPRGLVRGRCAAIRCIRASPAN